MPLTAISGTSQNKKKGVSVMSAKTQEIADGTYQIKWSDNKAPKYATVVITTGENGKVFRLLGGSDIKPEPKNIKERPLNLRKQYQEFISDDLKITETIDFDRESNLATFVYGTAHNLKSCIEKV